MNVIIYILTMHKQHDLSLENDCFHFGLFHLSDSEVYVICTFPFTAVMNCLCKLHSVTKELLQMCHVWQISFLMIFFISAISMLTIIDYVMPQCIVCHIFFRGSVIGLACSLLMVWMLTRWHYWCYFIRCYLWMYSFETAAAFMCSVKRSRKDNSTHINARHKIDLHVYGSAAQILKN